MSFRKTIQYIKDSKGKSILTSRIQHFGEKYIRTSLHKNKIPSGQVLSLIRRDQPLLLHKPSFLIISQQNSFSAKYNFAFQFSNMGARSNQCHSSHWLTSFSKLHTGISINEGYFLGTVLNTLHRLTQAILTSHSQSRSHHLKAHFTDEKTEVHRVNHFPQTTY